MKKTDQTEFVRESVHSVRENLVLRLLQVSLSLGLVAIIGVVLLYPSIFTFSQIASYISAYFILILVYILRNKFPYWFLAGSMLAVFFISGVLSMIFLGISSLSIPFLLLVSTISTLLFGTVFGIISVTAIILFIGLAGVLTVSGHLSGLPVQGEHIVSWSWWLSRMTGTLFIAGIAFISINVVYRKLVGLMEEREMQLKELNNNNQLLNAEINNREVIERELVIKGAALESALNAVAFADMDGRLTYVNSSYLKLWGCKNKGDAVGKRVASQWANKEEANRAIEETINSGRSQGILEALRQDGSIFFAQYAASIISDKHGKPLCMMAIFDDVTEQIQTKAKLINENAWQKVIQEASSMLNAQLSFDSSFKSVASALREIIPVDHMMIILKKDQQAVFEVVETRENELTTIQPRVSVPYVGSFLEYMEAHGCSYLIEDLNTECNFSEEEIIHRDGLRSCARLPLYDSGEFLGMLALSSHQPKAFNKSHIFHLEALALQVAYTVANIRRYQQVRNDAQRLAIIVREVHHRIKNNLQGIIGLFDRYCEDQPELAPIMNTAISQLYSVAEVHNLLSHNSQETVGWHALIQGVCAVTGHLSPHSMDFKLTPETAKLTISANEAVPMALALNELIQNAINHGYPDGRIGNIQISTDLVPEKGGARLVVANDGDSPPHSINKHSQEGVGIGLELVRSLLPDDADFLLHRKQEWTVAEITIPKKTFNNQNEMLEQ